MTRIDPWCRPKHVEPSGDPDVAAIYHSVGYALSGWESLENQLATIFSCLCGATVMAAQLAYGSVIAHSVRNAMLETAAGAFPFDDDTLKAKTLGLIDRVSKFSGRRNDIAHGLATRFTRNGILQGHYLCPPTYQTDKSVYSMLKQPQTPSSFMVAGKYQYTSAQIVQFAEHFNALGKEAMELIPLLLKRAIELQASAQTLHAPGGALAP